MERPPTTLNRAPFSTCLGGYFLPYFGGPGRYPSKRLGLIDCLICKLVFFSFFFFFFSLALYNHVTLWEGIHKAQIPYERVIINAYCCWEFVLRLLRLLRLFCR